MGLLDGLFGGSDNESKSTTKIPEYLNQFNRDYLSKIADQLDAARNVYNDRVNYKPYTGQRVQGFTPDEFKAYEKIRADMGGSEGDLGAARSALQGAQQQYGGPRYVGGDVGKATTDAYGGPNYVGGDVGKAQAGQFTGATVGQYLDPYKQSVLDQAMKTLGRERDRALLGDRAAATKNGALGSAGLALREAETQRGFADAAGSTAANILDQGYGRAADIYAGDQSRGLQAQGLNLQGLNTQQDMFNAQQGQKLQAQGLNLQGVGAEQGMFNQGRSALLQASQQAGNLAGQSQNIRQNDTNALLAAGQQQRQLGQTGLDLAYQDYQRQQDNPWQQLSNYTQITRGAPYSPSSASTTTQSAAGPSALQQLAGTGLAIAGAGSQFGFFNKGGLVKKRKPLRFGMGHA